MIKDKIVITGIGVLAPNGNNVAEFWSNLKAGVSGIGPITYFNTNNHKVKIAGELKNITADHIIDSKEIRKLDPFSVYAILATHEAMEMSGLNSDSFEISVPVKVSANPIPVGIKQTKNMLFKYFLISKIFKLFFFLIQLILFLRINNRSQISLFN